MNSNGSAYFRSGSRPPAASSVHRSSDPPMCRSPMNICGTLAQPPLRAIISSRAPGTASTSISSNATPFSTRSARARLQYEHPSTAYITTRGVPNDFQAARAASGARERQVVGTPGGEPPAQRDRPREPLGGELAYGGSGEGAGIVVDHDRFFPVLLHRVSRLQDLVSAPPPRPPAVA